MFDSLQNRYIKFNAAEQEILSFSFHDIFVLVLTLPTMQLDQCQLETGMCYCSNNNLWG